MLNKLSNKLIFSYIALTVLLVGVVFTLLGSLLRTIHIDILKTEMSRYNQLIDYKFVKMNIKSIPSEELTETVSELAKLMELRITIIKSDGSVIADSDVKDFLNLENHQYRKEIIDAINTGSGFTTRYSSTLKTDMLYYAKYKDNLIIRLSKPLYEVDRSLAELRKLIFHVAMYALIASILIIIIISIKIAKPFKETLSFASDFANGNFKRRILNYSNDEIGSLQKALNKMADTIVQTINDHILEQRKLEATLDSISDGIAMVDSNKQIVINNNSFLEMLGITSDLKGKQYFEIIRNSTLNSRIEKGLKASEKDIFEIEMSNDRFFESVITPIKGVKVIEGILIVIHDISEKRKIEKIKKNLTN